MIDKQENLFPVESKNILERAIKAIVDSEESINKVADKAVEILLTRMEDNPEAIPTKNLLEFIAKYQSNKVASQAVIKDLAIEVLKIHSTEKGLGGSDVRPPPDAAISALLNQNAKGGEGAQP